MLSLAASQIENCDRTFVYLIIYKVHTKTHLKALLTINRNGNSVRMVLTCLLSVKYLPPPTSRQCLCLPMRYIDSKFRQHSGVVDFIVCMHAYVGSLFLSLLVAYVVRIMLPITTP